MIFTETPINGAFLITTEPAQDERGHFARLWCQNEFKAHNLAHELSQCSVSYNKKKGTLRGLHYQAAPHEENKLIYCNKGRVFDVIVDLREHSDSFLKHLSVPLSAQNGTMLYVPSGVAHGFQTLEDDTELVYFISGFFDPQCARGLRWDDPTFNIEWPQKEDKTLSSRDNALPLYQEPKASS